jgi:hypothetical protein
VRAAVEHGLPGRLSVREQLSIDVNDHLVALTRCPGIELVVQRGLREQS